MTAQFYGIRKYLLRGGRDWLIIMSYGILATDFNMNYNLHIFTVQFMINQIDAAQLMLISEKHRPGEM